MCRSKTLSFSKNSDDFVVSVKYRCFSELWVDVTAKKHVTSLYTLAGDHSVEISVYSRVSTNQEFS